MTKPVIELRPMDTDELDEWLNGYWAPPGVIETDQSALIPVHTGHYSQLGGAWWCDTCNSPYCELA